MKILALDFDGVLVDSQYEALYTTYHAYLRINPKTRIFGGKRFKVKEFDKIKRKYKKYIDEFIKVRPFTISASDYLVMIDAINKGIKLKTQNDFNKYSKRLDKKKGDFVKKFYLTRKKSQKNNFKEWCKLTSPYPKIFKRVKQIKNFKIVVATNNEAGTVIKTMANFSFKLRKGDVFDRSSGENKKDKMIAISKKYKVRYKDIYFIDDQIRSLLRAKQLNVNCFLAKWGYITKEQLRIAKENEINLLTERGFLNLTK